MSIPKQLDSDKVLDFLREYHKTVYLGSLKSLFLDAIFNTDVKIYRYRRCIENTKPKFITYSKKECSICLEKLVGKISSCPTCHIKLHTDCLTTMMFKNNDMLCPYCRQSYYKVETKMDKCCEPKSEKCYPTVLDEEDMIKMVSKYVDRNGDIFDLEHDVKSKMKKVSEIEELKVEWDTSKDNLMELVERISNN